eukprot:GGOE01043774.1.p1 GENE.GGOE01043774.1~~GGOE01043774.1.p1  ORF type:complete len:413 (+),score=79.99 GGOE01043774.1:83-1321(+)
MARCRGRGDWSTWAATVSDRNCSEKERLDALDKLFDCLLLEEESAQPQRRKGSVASPSVVETVLKALTDDDAVALAVAERVLPLLCSHGEAARQSVLKGLAAMSAGVPESVRAAAYKALTSVQGWSDPERQQMESAVGPPGCRRDQPHRPQRPIAALFSNIFVLVFALLFLLLGLGWAVYSRHDQSQSHTTDVAATRQCQPPPPSDVALLHDNVLKLVPVTAHALLHMLRAERVPRARATSLHLLGVGHSDVKERIVDVVAHEQGATAPDCIHRATGRDYAGIEEEVYTVGRRCPCSVVVWEDVTVVDPAERSIFKRLCDDNPGKLQLRNATGTHGSDGSVDIRRMTFVLISNRDLKGVPPSESEGLETAALEVQQWGPEASRKLGLWPDRVNHVIRYHLPILPSAAGHQAK